jgi:purine-nucleoside phosphorylase
VTFSPQSRPQLQFTQEHSAVGHSHPALGLHARERIEACAQAVRARFARPVEVAIILGTGLGGLASEIEVEQTIEYKDLPNFPLSTVESHHGRLLCGMLGGRTVVAMQGRFHRYEGYSLQQVTFPVRVLRALGADTLIVSNACGGMHPLWAAGDLMVIEDHINLIGDNPLIGINDERLGPRFPDMSAPYTATFIDDALAVARRENFVAHKGVYVAVTGPNLETRAEYRFLRTIGADVVGMSTVPEVVVAVHSGMKVLGISVITDMCLPDALEVATVDHILATARSAEPKLRAIVVSAVRSAGRVYA